MQFTINSVGLIIKLFGTMYQIISKEVRNCIGINTLKN